MFCDLVGLDGLRVVVFDGLVACEGLFLLAEGLEDYKNALAAYEKAAATADNMYSAGYLLKAGQVCEEMGNKDKALDFYKKIKDQYPESAEASDIDKYITRIEF